MAVHAKAHRQIHLTHRHRLLRHVAVAGCAVDPGADMRRMVKLHVNLRAIGVNALPRNILATLVVTGELLDFGAIRSDGLMAHHAEFDAGNCGVRSCIDPRMAVGALHCVSQVHLVRKCDRLDGLSLPIEEIAHGAECRAMRGRENRRGLWAPSSCLRCRALCLQKERRRH